MTAEEKKKIYAALAAPFPEECIQRTNGKTTGKGYDTSGIGYQHVVNRLNEILGVGCFRAHRTVTVKEISRASGRAAYEAICDLTLELGQYIDGGFVTWAEALADGGHVASSEADARKGAFTNAFKKAAAFFGVGRQAYEGTLDDDNVPVDAPAAPRPMPLSSAKASATPAPSQANQPHQHSSAGGAQAQHRNRLTSKQLSAIWSLARKAGYDQSAFRARVKAKFGVTLEFLDRNAASTLIGQLSKQPVPNGHAPTSPELPVPATGA